MINKIFNMYFIISLSCIFLFTLLSIMIFTVTYENYAFAATYNYAPSFTATGSNKLDVPDASNLRLSSFTVATWFKTTANFPDEGVMVNKGGLGSENAGLNQNYGIWFTPSETLQGGFETTGGSNKYVTSTRTYNDGQWHHGVVTFDNNNNIVRLFVDGVQIGSLSTTSNPDNTGNKPLRIAGNSQSLTEDFFIGQLDEVGVWNRALTNTEISNLMNTGQFPSSGLVYSNSFSTSTPEICNDNIDNDGDEKIDAEDLDCPSVPEICNNGLDDDRDGLKDVADEDCQTAIGYHYAPFFTATGSNKLDVPNAPNLRLSSFTVATWFKTTANFPDEGVMVNKGGLGSESAGANQNYGIWFTPSERLQGGFENTGGGNRYIASANAYNDGQWHHGVVTFDNPNNIVRLFVDGVQIGSLSTSSNPDNTGNQPLRIAGNAQSLTEDFYIGQLDEVGVWNRTLTNPEITHLKNNGVFASSGLVYSNSFGPPPPQEICNNGIDDDGDKLIDTADPDCQTPEICNDNIDNDGDALVDIADPDCQQYCFDFQWGSQGTGNGQFIRPHDVVFDSSGIVYVLDRSRADVQKFTPGGQFISKFGSAGSNPGEFLEPYSMFIDPSDNLYIVDKGNDRIQKLTKNGIPLSVIGGFSTPEDLAMDRNGNFFVTDTGADRVIKFNQNFTFIYELGSTGDGPGEFEHPHGIGVDSVGNLYVNDAFSPRIQKFTNDGFFIKQWGSLGTGNGQFTLPLEHLEVDSPDKVFMVDSESNPRVQLFDTEGNFITKFGESSGAGELDVPEHVGIDTQGNVYVVDRGDRTMKVFKQCPAALSSLEGLGFLTTIPGDQMKDLLSNLPSMIGP
jgi:hypothetical protein